MPLPDILAVHVFSCQGERHGCRKSMTPAPMEKAKEVDGMVAKISLWDQVWAENSDRYQCLLVVHDLVLGGT